MSKTRNQFAGTLLLLLAVAAVFAAILSLNHLRAFPLHDDGVTWVDHKTSDGQNHVLASYISPGGPGDKAGVRVGDELLKIQSFPIRTALQVPQALWAIPLPGPTPASYVLRRDGIEFQKNYIFIQAARRDSALYYQYAVGFFYLAIGLFVYYRRTNAAKSLHFFILCLVSFPACCFHYSGKLNTFDEGMYWGNLAAGLFAPAIFLHFCLSFHVCPRFLQRRGAWLVLYAPSALVLAAVAASAEGLLRFGTPLLEVRWFLDRVTLGFSMLVYFAGAAALGVNFAQEDDPMVRRQLKYLRNGALVGLIPFTLLYALPYIVGCGSHARDESERPLDGADSADVGVRDHTLPADGCRHYLPARVCLHARDLGGHRHVLRAHLSDLQDEHHSASGRGGPDRVRDVHLSADPALDSGATGPLGFLS